MVAWIDEQGLDGVTGTYIRMVTGQTNETAESTGSGTGMLPRVYRPDAHLFWKMGDYNIIALSLCKYSPACEGMFGY